MKKSSKNLFKKLTALILTVMTVFSLLTPAITVNAEGETQVVSQMTYTLKNKGSGKYLTVPGNTDELKNVYQSASANNDQYMRTVRIAASGDGYTMSPLVSENFDGGYVSVSESNNVYVSEDQETTTVWSFAYSASRGGFIITNESGLMLTTLGNSSGSLVNTGTSSVGNIFVASDRDSDYQVWILERITVNPHLVRSSDTIEKKNIAKNGEWLISLPGAERNYRDITGYTVHSPNNLVEVVHNGGDYLAVKIKENDDTAGDRNDNYAVIDILVDGYETRTLVVSDAGSSTSQACRTFPFEYLSTYHKIILDPDDDYNQMLTFRSWVGNVAIEEWNIIDDFDCIEFDLHGSRPLLGSNYAVINAVKPGFAVVTAKATDGYVYKMVIEVELDVTPAVGENGTVNDYVDNYIIEIDDTDIDSYDIEIQKFRNYLIKTEPHFTLWSAQSGGSTSILAWGNDHAVISCDHAGDSVLTATRTDGETFAVNVTPAKGAIIILPGIMGSQLYAGEDILDDSIAYTVYSEGENLWLPVDAGESILLDTAARIKLLAMNADGTSKHEIVTRAPLVNTPSDGGIDHFRYGTLGTYRKLYDELYSAYHASYGYDIILYEYDWRYDPYNTAQNLDTYISNIGYKDVVFVAHSMGSNVASYYVSLGESQRARINKSIYIGPMHLGSEKLLYAYVTGQPILQADTPLLIEEAIASILPNIPSAYSLLPTEMYFSSYLSYRKADGQLVQLENYDDTMSALSTYMPGWNNAVANSAISNLDRLFDSRGNHISTWVNSNHIVGTNCDTITKITLEMNSTDTAFLVSEYAGSNSNQLEFYEQNVGDGTVTLHSATANYTIPMSRVFFKTNTDSFEADHTIMASGLKYGIITSDETTIDFISVILELNGDEIDNIDVDNYLMSNFGIERRLS